MPDELDQYASSEEVVAKQNAKRAEFEMERTRSIMKTVRLVGLWVVLACIFVAVLATNQDPASVKYYAGGLATLGFFLTIFM